MSQESYKSRLAEWQKAQFSPAPAPSPEFMEPAFVERVPMRDGVHLHTEIFVPNQLESVHDRHLSQYPVILIRTPYLYSRPSRTVEHYLNAGYIFVFQLTRGQGESEGVFRFFRDDINDGYDAIQWIAAQPWSNGRVGMLGSSYMGGVQLLAARSKPPALKCIMPTGFIGNYTRCYPFANGVLKKGRFMQWLQLVDATAWDQVDVEYGDMNAINHPKWGPALRHRPLVEAADSVLSGDKLACWREIVAHPKDDAFWQALHFTDDQLAELDIPIFITDGWYDTTTGPIDFFSRLEKTQPGCHDRYLLVGPWNHYQMASVATKPGDDDGDRILPNNGVVDLLKLRLAFFDRYLKEDQTVRVQEDRVRVYITGINQWFGFPTFPAPETQPLSLYLHSQGDARSFPGNGQLAWEPPSAASSAATDCYTYDPVLPTKAAVESFKDRRDTEIRSDVLTYTSAPLEEPLTILGDIELILHAASDAPDTDWFAIITEVFPDGQSKSFHYAPPAFRARYREGFDREVFLTSGQPGMFRIPMGPAGHQIAAGNRLRLSIFSASFPEFEPNTNTGREAATDEGIRIASQTIFHDKGRPSQVILPIVNVF